MLSGRNTNVMFPILFVTANGTKIYRLVYYTYVEESWLDIQTFFQHLWGRGAQTIRVFFIVNETLTSYKINKLGIFYFIFLVQLIALLVHLQSL
jgi:hypothetical protein